MEDFKKYIDPQDLQELLTNLIRSKSLNPPGDVRECAGLIADELKRRNLPAEIWEEKPGVANVVSFLEGQAGGKTLLWNGHFDVVPAGENWEGDPFGGELRDGFIYGRGSSDMKSGLAAMIAALSALRMAGAPFRGRIVFQAVGDEETGSEGGTLLMIRKKIGADAAYAKPVSAEYTQQIEESLGLQMISIRLDKGLIDSFKAISAFHGVGYQPLMRDALKRFAEHELRNIVQGVVESQRKKVGANLVTEKAETKQVLRKTVAKAASRKPEAMKKAA